MVLFVALGVYVKSKDVKKCSKSLSKNREID
jgi:hypothetical protein